MTALLETSRARVQCPNSTSMGFPGLSRSSPHAQVTP